MTMTSHLPANRSRRAWLALAAAAALVALLIGLPVAMIFQDQSNDMADSLHTLAVFRAEIAARPALESKLADLRARAASDPGLIKSDNAALAEAEIQSEIKTIVASNQGEVHSAQPLSPARNGKFEVIAVVYDIVLPLARLSSFLYAVESHTPYFFIDDSDLLAGQAWDTQDTAPPGTIPKIELHCTIRAYRWSAQ